MQLAGVVRAQVFEIDVFFKTKNLKKWLNIMVLANTNVFELERKLKGWYLFSLEPKKKSSLVLGTNVRETSRPPRLSPGLIFSHSSVLCVLCIPLCRCPATRLRKVTGHKGGRHWGRVGGWGVPACLSSGNKMGGGWWSHKSAWASFCESLRDGDSQAAARGHLCTEELLSGSLHQPPSPPPASVRPTKRRRGSPPQATQPLVISTYGRLMAALPSVKTWGQICRGRYVTQTSQTPGGDERRSGSFFTRTITGYFRAEMCHNNTERPLHLWVLEGFFFFLFFTVGVCDHKHCSRGGSSPEARANLPLAAGCLTSTLTFKRRISGAQTRSFCEGNFCLSKISRF